MCDVRKSKVRAKKCWSKLQGKFYYPIHPSHSSWLTLLLALWIKGQLYSSENKVTLHEGYSYKNFLELIEWVNNTISDRESMNLLLAQVGEVNKLSTLYIVSHPASQVQDLRDNCSGLHYHNHSLTYVVLHTLLMSITCDYVIYVDDDDIAFR